MRAFVAARAICTIAIVFAFAGPAAAQKGVLKDVRQIQVGDTVIVDPPKVKEDSAGELVKSVLRNAVQNSGIQVGDAPLTALIELREFSSGSRSMRFWIALGSGRATIDADLVLKDGSGQVLARRPIKTKGDLRWGEYQSNTKQRTDAFDAFKTRLLEEIARLR
jgi:hypothetical protein